MSANPVRLFSADLDGTLVGGPAGARQFTQAWESLDRGLRPLLVYNTRRTILSTRQLVAAQELPEPDYIIGSSGTELFAALYDFERDFRERIGGSWDLERVEEIVTSHSRLHRSAAESALPFKSTWTWPQARSADITDLHQRLNIGSLRAHVDYSSRLIVDIVPISAGKGRALEWLCARLNLPLRDIVVAGDAGDDTSVFRLPAIRGIAVCNALPELLTRIRKRTTFIASLPHAAGVLEGLRYFGVVFSPPPEGLDFRNPSD